MAIPLDFPTEDNWSVLMIDASNNGFKYKETFEDPKYLLLDFLLRKGVFPHVVPCMRVTVYTTKKDLVEGHVHKDYTDYDAVKDDPWFVFMRGGKARFLEAVRFYFNDPRCKELVLGVLDDEEYYTSLKHIVESSANQKITLLEHPRLGENLKSYFPTTGSLASALE